MARRYCVTTNDRRTFGVPRLREQVSKMLAEAYAQNYIDSDDYEDRLAQVQTAKNRGEVFRPVSDFPDYMLRTYLAKEAEPGGDPEGGGAARPQGSTDTREREQPSSQPVFDENATHTAVFSSTDIPFHQIGSDRVSVFSLFGETRIDLSGLLPSEDFHVYAKAVFGEVKIQVPENAQIVRHCQTLFGEVKIRTAPPQGPGPVVHLHGILLFGSVRVSGPKLKNRITRAFSSLFS